MSSPPNFKNWGDWLVWWSTGPFGDFQMPKCVGRIFNEGRIEGWVNYLTEDDVKRVLARYKEHVSYWNVNTQVIPGELFSFAQAVNRDYNYIVQIFNSLPPKRIPFEP